MSGVRPSQHELKIAYLTSVYPRASDLFIRTEIDALRRLGCDVSTFAIHRPKSDQVVSDEIKRELRATRYVLPEGSFALVRALVVGLVRCLAGPRTLQCVRLAWRIRWAGLKGHVWPLVYLSEAALLAAELQKAGITHLHNHIGENSAAVAMLASAMADIPYSLTIHGPYEFDIPERLGLQEKIAQSKFVVAISEYTRAQLWRWCRPEDRSKVHIVRCAVSQEFLVREVSGWPETPSLVCVGRLCPEKGQTILLQALAILKSRGIRVPLTLVGDGPDRAVVEGTRGASRTWRPSGARGLEIVISSPAGHSGRERASSAFVCRRVACCDHGGAVTRTASHIDIHCGYSGVGSAR